MHFLYPKAKKSFERGARETNKLSDRSIGTIEYIIVGTDPEGRVVVDPGEGSYVAQPRDCRVRNTEHGTCSQVPQPTCFSQSQAETLSRTSQVPRPSCVQVSWGT